MNKVQKAAYALIQSDARFLYAITKIKGVKSNYICMGLPYFGLFADGAEQWCRKVGLNAPQFNEVEKSFYADLRENHKFFDKIYEEYRDLLLANFGESENHFFGIRSLREKILGYYNVGTDVIEREFCGNTILCNMYMPISIFDNNGVGLWMKEMTVIAGELAGFFKCRDFPIYEFNKKLKVKPKDYHFYKNSPLNMNTELGFLLFSILCSVNYVLEFIDKYFVEEIPQKFKFAYLQYYYLCEFIKELNLINHMDFYIDGSMCNRELRNCFAHYGLGQYMVENEIIDNDLLKGLTNKAFDQDYHTAKKRLFDILKSLTQQIKKEIFL